MVAYSKKEIHNLPDKEVKLMETEDLAKLIKERRSIRVWENRAVDADLLLQAIELATYAPNGGNQQNWKFYVITDKGIIDSIADAVQASADYIAALPEAKKFGEMVVGYTQRASFFCNAPSMIAVAARQYQSPIDEILAAREKVDAKACQMRQWRNIADSRIQSVAAAIAYLLLVLHQMGLGAVWMTGPLQAKGEIETLLKIPPEMDVIALVPAGYPDENPVIKERRPLREVCEIIN
jgi:nitroreductase